MVVTSKGSKINHIVVQREFDIEAATKRFSIKNNLGEGRYGPVYKVYKLLSNYIYCGIAPSSLQCFKF